MLCAHRPFDVVTGIVIDAMHCIFLGVVSKTLIPFWFNVTHHSKPFSIRRKVCLYINVLSYTCRLNFVVQLRECNDRLTKIQVPHDFSRAVKGLDQIKLWKGMY